MIKPLDKGFVWFFRGDYIATAFYYNSNDGTVLVSFMAILFFLIGIKFYLEDNLKEELYRYKKYLVLKRKRANKIKVVNK